MGRNASPRRGSSRLRRWAGVLLAIALWPALAGYTAALIGFLASVRVITGAHLAFLVGMTAYLAWHTMVGRPLKLYLFGHELMHAVAAWLSGGQVKAFKVTGRGGSVTATKSGFFIALAPYLIPVYSVLAALAYVVLGWFWEVELYAPWFYGALGASLAFHFAFTAEFVKTRQPDLVASGRLLSLTTIYWVNLAVVALAVSIITPRLQVWDYLADGSLRSAGLYRAAAQQLLG